MVTLGSYGQKLKVFRINSQCQI